MTDWPVFNLHFSVPDFCPGTGLYMLVRFACDPVHALLHASSSGFQPAAVQPEAAEEVWEVMQHQLEHCLDQMRATKGQPVSSAAALQDSPSLPML